MIQILRNVLFLILFVAAHVSADKPTTKHGWTYLFDKDMSKWTTYLGIPRPETMVTGIPKDEKGNYTQAVGFDKDERGVFTTSVVEGEPVLHVTGEIYGSVHTKQDFENYHLVVQFKWGTQKWPPRLTEPLDTGILYHVIGEHGVDYWKAWALSQEFQIMEHNTGDWWQIAGSQIDIRCEKVANETVPVYNPKAPILSYGPGGAGITCMRGKDAEKPKGEWNTLELITFGDKSLHIVNGQVVMALSNSRYTQDGKVIPLTKGKILLQSEAGEAFFKGVKIKSIKGIPAQYKSYFN
ncbi:MAG: DUF1080 domain-containing protein [Gammaproteobacteria bacterium]|nr:MAG: DUF1080 domain-containing protein [Gammaproteobacteria bacterium]